MEKSGIRVRERVKEERVLDVCQQGIDMARRRKKKKVSWRFTLNLILFCFAVWGLWEKIAQWFIGLGFVRRWLISLAWTGLWARVFK